MPTKTGKRTSPAPLERRDDHRVEVAAWLVHQRDHQHRRGERDHLRVGGEEREQRPVEALHQGHQHQRDAEPDREVAIDLLLRLRRPARADEISDLQLSRDTDRYTRHEDVAQHRQQHAVGGQRGGAQPRQHRHRGDLRDVVREVLARGGDADGEHRAVEARRDPPRLAQRQRDVRAPPDQEEGEQARDRLAEDRGGGHPDHAQHRKAERAEEAQRVPADGEDQGEDVDEHRVARVPPRAEDARLPDVHRHEEREPSVDGEELPAVARHLRVEPVERQERPCGEHHQRRDAQREPEDQRQAPDADQPRLPATARAQVLRDEDRRADRDHHVEQLDEEGVLHDDAHRRHRLGGVAAEHHRVHAHQRGAEEVLDEERPGELEERDLRAVGLRCGRRRHGRGAP